MKTILFFLLICFCNCCFAQSDTSIFYYAKNGSEIRKDSAYTFMRIYKQGDLWYGKEYYVKNNTLRSEGNFADKNGKTPVGNFNNYTENGKIDYTGSYNGKVSEFTYYYKSGNKKSLILLDGQEVKKQKGWDESGKEIKNFVVMREASYKGGPEGWKKYLEKNLNANVAADANAPAGQYTVELTFKVSAQGYTSNVKAISVPDLCKPCGTEAVQVILNSKEWQPAMLQNEPVEYSAKQFITFVVEGNKKSK